VESSWRMNVATYGLDPSRMTLCSRVLGFDNLIVSNWIEPPMFCVGFFQISQDPGNWNYPLLLPRLNGTDRFPYGWPVPAD